MLLNWTDDKFCVGNQEMDDTHKEFVDLLNEIDGASDDKFATLFDQLIEHTEAHFANESRLMSESSFPALGEHEGEHQKLLGEMLQIKKRVDAGRLTLPRAFVKERLVDWFMWHASSMDAPLAGHLERLAKS